METIFRRYDMRLLIVDDEDLTREGLVSSIDWSALNINYIYQADDGLNALSMVQKYMPEIILSDVRMPRMSGIEMAERVQEISPDSSVIFMSGYSDKEYLKAAIKLKAIRYVEKPINPDEVIDAVKEAIAHFEMKQITNDSLHHHKRELAFQLAQSLLYPVEQEESLNKALSSLGIQTDAATSYTTVMAKFAESLTDVSKRTIEETVTTLSETAARLNSSLVYTTKQDEYLILHLIINYRDVKYCLHEIVSMLITALTETEKFFIAVGRTVHTPREIYESYQSAVILLQSSFFFEYGSTLTYDDEHDSADAHHNDSNALLSKTAAELTELLMAEDADSLHALLDTVYQSLHNSRSILANQAKDLYYKLFMAIHDAALNLHIHLKDDEDFDTILDYISHSDTLSALHARLTEKTDLFLSMNQIEEDETSTVFLIKDFISRHYADETLSVKDISEQVFLSPSYVCTVFKNETGLTLNQYLTQYRIERAKKLLQDPRYKINDISSKVGYNDGNYFGKTFKKIVGLSPSEYREQNIR